VIERRTGKPVLGLVPFAPQRHQIACRMKPGVACHRASLTGRLLPGQAGARLRLHVLARFVQIVQS